MILLRNLEAAKEAIVTKLKADQCQEDLEQCQENLKQCQEDLEQCKKDLKDTIILAKKAATAAEGNEISDEMISSVQSALESDLEPFDDLNCSAKTKIHYAKELTGRILRTLIS